MAISLSEKTFVSEDGLVYKTYKWTDGVTRRRYQCFCGECGIERYVQRSHLNRHLCQSCASKNMTEEHKNKIAQTLRDKYKNDANFKRKVAAARNVKKGAEHWNWKGGVTSLNQRTRTSEDAYAWKLAVLSRDKYTCRMCGSKDNLHAHHINSWSEFPEDRFILENGLTLCKSCHDFYHKYEKEVKNNETIKL